MSLWPAEEGSSVSKFEFNSVLGTTPAADESPPCLRVLVVDDDDRGLYRLRRPANYRAVRDGIAFVRRIRKHDAQVPIVFAATSGAVATNAGATRAHPCAARRGGSTVAGELPNSLSVQWK